MNLLALALTLSCLPPALIDFALPKWKADRNTRIEDAYKWTYQATRGGEHAVPDEDSARTWLDREWRSLGAAKRGELVWEPLCSGGEIGRLNLRPFHELGGKQDELLTSFLESSRSYRARESTFIAAWLELGKRLKKRASGKLVYSEWARLNAEMKAKDYPAIHHSKSFQNAKQPAYRILTSAEMKKLLANQK